MSSKTEIVDAPIDIQPFGGSLTQSLIVDHDSVNDTVQGVSVLTVNSVDNTPTLPLPVPIAADFALTVPQTLPTTPPVPVPEPTTPPPLLSSEIASSSNHPQLGDARRLHDNASLISTPTSFAPMPPSPPYQLPYSHMPPPSPSQLPYSPMPAPPPYDPRPYSPMPAPPPYDPRPYSPMPAPPPYDPRPYSPMPAPPPYDPRPYSPMPAPPPYDPRPYSPMPAPPPYDPRPYSPMPAPPPYNPRPYSPMPVPPPYNPLPPNQLPYRPYISSPPPPYNPRPYPPMPSPPPLPPLNELTNADSSISVKLTKNNYIHWHFELEQCLKNNNLFGYVDGSIPPPPSRLPTVNPYELANPAFELWTRQDQLITGLLISSMSEEVIPPGAGYFTSRSIWEDVRKEFVEPSSLQDQFIGLKQKDKSIHVYLQQAKSIYDALSAIGNQPTEQVLLIYIRRGLQDSVKGLDSYIYSLGSDMTFEELRHFLITTSYYDNTDLSPSSSTTRDSLPTPPPTTINNANHGSSSQFHGAGRGVPQDRYPPPPSVHSRRCYICESILHLVNTCPHQHPTTLLSQTAGSQYGSPNMPYSPAVSYPTSVPDNGAAQNPEAYSGSDGIQVANGKHLNIHHTDLLESGEKERKQEIKRLGEKPSTSREDEERLLEERLLEEAILKEADEPQHWKRYLWLQIIQHDKDTIQQVLDSAPNRIKGLNIPIRESGQTILNAAIKKRLDLDLIKKLVKLMSDNDLEMKDQHGQTALHEAIHARNVPLADLLIKNTPALVSIKDKDGRLPVELAAINQKRDLTFSLHKNTLKDYEPYLDTESGALLSALSAELYDLVLYILKDDPDLKPDAITPLLKYFVDEPRAFLSRTPLNTWQSLIYPCISVNTTEIMENFERETTINDPDDGNSSSKELETVILPVHKATKKMRGVLLQIHKVSKKVWEKIDTVLLPVHKTTKKMWGGAQILNNSHRLLLQIHKVSKKVREKIVQPIEDLRKAKIRHLLAIEILRNVCWRMSYIWFEDESSLIPLFLLAAENGIHEMVETILDAFPQAIKFHNDDGHSALHIAAMYRHEKIFSIALKKSPPSILNLADKKGEVLFFRVAHNALQSRLDPGAGVVFRMQRELRWYKELEKIVPDQRKTKNKELKTPIEVFKETHQDLVGYENKWMLEMANSCIVGGALIVTVVFAAAITVPGGNNDSGLPTFLSEKAYTVFAFLNALSLIFSITSVLIFLSIFTSPHSINDYLYSLPNKIILGLMFLFFAVTSLMADFTAIMYLVSGPTNRKDAFSIAALALIPIVFFGCLQLPSLLNMMGSTYWYRPFLPSQLSRSR